MEKGLLLGTVGEGLVHHRVEKKPEETLPLGNKAPDVCKTVCEVVPVIKHVSLNANTLGQAIPRCLGGQS